MCGIYNEKMWVAGSETSKYSEPLSFGTYSWASSVLMLHKEGWKSGFYWLVSLKDAKGVCEVFDVWGLDFIRTFPESRGLVERTLLAKVVFAVNAFAELSDGAYEILEFTQEWTRNGMILDFIVIKILRAIEITDRDGFSFKVNGQRLKKYYGGNIDKDDDEVIELENDERGAGRESSLRTSHKTKVLAERPKLGLGNRQMVGGDFKNLEIGSVGVLKPQDVVN
ncbi:hypothetical protein Tco_0701949 [Tanacetum coccineum]|uniref:Uncharacterized protein n=1 Tax=Tanacetum coccineum TaxID=301880 RepID=A0ABQ4XWK0_9ASTR